MVPEKDVGKIKQVFIKQKEDNDGKKALGFKIKFLIFKQNNSSTKKNSHYLLQELNESADQIGYPQAKFRKSNPMGY